MRVDRKTGVTTAASSGVRRGASGASFQLDSGTETARTAAPAQAATLGGIESLLVLQGEGDATERRKRSVKRGHDLLDALDRLKADLLAGRVSTAELERLSANLRERIGSSGDPGLDDILAHIELRAQVELAKLKR